MANPCPPFTQHHLVPERTRSNLKFSSGQIDFLKQMARESRPGFSVPRLRNKSAAAQGTLALFSGLRGTGKMMAANILARESRLSLYPVNLNQLTSQFIGETEKNLTRVLKIAEAKRAVLLLDEVEALLGIRSEVNESHDRYANIEVGYVLERLNSYPGLVILVVNQQVDLDPRVGCFLKYHLKFSPPLSSLNLKRR